MTELKMSVYDLDFECCNCGETFTWTEGEQHFYRLKGYPRPRRCVPCRNAKKLRHSAGNSEHNSEQNSEQKEE